MKTARLALCLVLAGTAAALASVPSPPLQPLSGAAGLKLRVTMEIKNATVEEAAKKLSTVLGGRVQLFDLLTAYSGNYTLNRNRRASLAWKDAPIGQVVRDFDRAYQCMVSPYGGGTFAVWPWRPPLGPVHESGGYQFEVTGSGYQLSNSRLGLLLSVRSTAGDAAAVGRLERLRIMDEQGREVERPAEGSREFYSEERQGGYPDERLLNASVDWPRPAPQRLRVVEGAVRVYQKVRRLEVEVPFPGAGKKEAVGEAGGLRVRLSDIKFRPSREPQGPGSGFDPGGFLAHVRVSGPAGLSVEVAGQPAFGEAVFADRTRVLVDARHVYSPFFDLHPEDGQYRYVSGDVYSKSGPDRRPVKLGLPLIVRSELGKSLPFRIENVSIERGR